MLTSPVLDIQNLLQATESCCSRSLEARRFVFTPPSHTHPYLNPLLFRTHAPLHPGVTIPNVTSLVTRILSDFAVDFCNFRSFRLNEGCSANSQDALSIPSGGRMICFAGFALQGRWKGSTLSKYSLQDTSLQTHLTPLKFQFVYWLVSRSAPLFGHISTYCLLHPSNPKLYTVSFNTRLASVSSRFAQLSLLDVCFEGSIHRIEVALKLGSRFMFNKPFNPVETISLYTETMTLSFDTSHSTISRNYDSRDYGGLKSRLRPTHSLSIKHRAMPELDYASLDCIQVNTETMRKLGRLCRFDWSRPRASSSVYDVHRSMINPRTDWCCLIPEFAQVKSRYRFQPRVKLLDRLELKRRFNCVFCRIELDSTHLYLTTILWVIPDPFPVLSLDSLTGIIFRLILSLNSHYGDPVPAR
ncbi:hypothetical protein R3P38DRAFT_2762407 [Favolaschia claudopus]|uniref:Uncharacterized protein n=1 Tax=Favolaschia claudopus TaxID=2862362 RepID=A0AAW0DJ46_9AGAR